MTPLTVVIPTYNRCETLQKAVSAYLDQTASQSIREILIVDDGSTDSTSEVVAAASRDSSVPIRYFRQSNKGPAAARNVGIREANGELILFTDDDIIPGSAFVTEHLEWHRRLPDSSTAVLGQVTWHPDVRPTPFMEWYGSDGALFGFSHLAGQTEVGYEYLYSCNLSLNTDFLRKHGTFDEDFKVAAYEDSELGYRLGKAGMRLLYNPRALAFHYQTLTFEDACRRARKCAVAEMVFKQKEAGIHYYSSHPLQKVSTLKTRVAKPFLWPLKRMMNRRIPLPWSIYRAVFRAFS